MSIFHHFRSDEKPFVERVMEWTELAHDRYQPRLTHFLDPREQFIVQAIVSRNDAVKVAFYGGYEQAERKRAFIFPEFIEVNPGDYELTLLSFYSSVKPLKLAHRDILGSLLGTGIKREKLGDILLSEKGEQVIVAADIAPYLQMQLTQIGRLEVYCEPIDWQHLIIPSEAWKTKETSVSSLRLDVILAELLPISRSKALPLIKAGKVKVNWKVIEQPALQLQESDILSIKGYGRFLFVQIEGITKKQKYRITLGRKE